MQVHPVLGVPRDRRAVRHQVEVDPPQGDRHDHAEQADHDAVTVERPELRHPGDRADDHLAEHDDDEQAEPLDQRRRRRDARLAPLLGRRSPSMQPDPIADDGRDQRDGPQPVPDRLVHGGTCSEQHGRDEVPGRVRRRSRSVIWIMKPSPEPQHHEDRRVRGVREREADRAVARNLRDVHGHHRDGEHLGEREHPRAHVVRPVQVVIHRPVRPRRPHHVEQEDEPSDSGPRHVLREPFGHLGDDHDEDEVEEQFQERHAPIGLAVGVPPRRLPQPWARTGPGEAKDGKPKFDLTRLDDGYFDRLRERVAAAGERGIYVDVLLFDGFALHLSPAPDNVEGHPFHAANNVNGVGIQSIVDYQVLPLDSKVQEFEDAYIRRVVDTLHDLPNVLYEVANESSGGGGVNPEFAAMLGESGQVEWGNSTEWQYWVIERVRTHTAERRYDAHPIGITMQFPVQEQTRVNDPLFGSDADWISPGYDDEIFATGELFPQMPGAPPTRWLVDPPPNDGRKVVINDTDHYSMSADALWAWKSFVRGNHPIL